jgi:hypothetical protein
VLSRHSLKGGVDVRGHPFSPPSCSNPPLSTPFISVTPMYLCHSLMALGASHTLLLALLKLRSVFWTYLLDQVTFISFLLSILVLFLYLFSIVYKVSYFISHIVTVALPSRSHTFLLGSPARCTSCNSNVSIYLFRSICKLDRSCPYRNPHNPELILI